MSTIIRVKRHFTEDPVEAIVLACKKRKTDLGEDFTTVLSFTGTLPVKDDAAVTPDKLQTLKEKLDPKKFYKTSPTIVDSLNKRRQETQSQSEKNRFKVISCYRASSSNDETADSNSSKSMTIVDVDLEEIETKSDLNKEPNYVYDVYHAVTDNFDDMLMESLLSVHAVPELEFRSSEDAYEGYLDPDEDDSNDESNWRNDYPDSDHSINEDDIRLAVQFDGLGIENELSSDSGEEGYLNYEDRSTRDMFGESYSNYKACVLKDEEEDGDGEDDEEAY